MRSAVLLICTMSVDTVCVQSRTHLVILVAPSVVLSCPHDPI